MSTDESPIYSMDTGGFIDGLDRYYRAKNFPSLWEKFDHLISNGRVIASMEVWREIEPHTEFVRTWVSEAEELRMSLFVDDLEIVAEIEGGKESICKSFPRLANPRTGRSRVDPYVIAAAKVFGATVVTSEVGGSIKNPKIPSVCDQLNIPCINLAELIRQEGWVF